MRRIFSYDDIRGPQYSTLEEAVKDQNENGFFESRSLTPVVIRSGSTYGLTRPPLKPIDLRVGNKVNKINSPFVEVKPKQNNPGHNAWGYNHRPWKMEPQYFYKGTMNTVNKPQLSRAKKETTPSHSSHSELAGTPSSLKKGKSKVIADASEPLVERKANIPTGIPFAFNGTEKWKFCRPPKMTEMKK